MSVFALCLEYTFRQLKYAWKTLCLAQSLTDVEVLLSMERRRFMRKHTVMKVRAKSHVNTSATRVRELRGRHVTRSHQDHMFPRPICVAMSRAMQ